MQNTTESEILEAEEKLRLAMLHSDVGTLDKLLSPDLIFTNHLGQVMRKEDDLSTHRSGLLEINEIKLSEQNIQIRDKIAIVSVKVFLLGSYAGNSSEGDFRFTRVWVLSDKNNWQVIAGHSSVVA